jgi:23S rRNA (guanosine2251-2'-O)-methyltransferase
MNRKLKLNELGRVSTETFKQLEKIPLVVILDNIRSHHNVGSVFRTADAFRVEKIILCGYTPVPPHRDIHKTALGATDSVEWSYSESTLEAVNWAKEQGYTTLAVEQTENSVKLNELEPSQYKGLALVFGNEVGGVEQDVIDACDQVLEVPMEGTKHSLNISVCAGIVLWEVFNKIRRS